MDLSVALGDYERWRTTQARYSPHTWDGERPGLVAFVTYATACGAHRTSRLTEELLDAWWAQLQLADSTRHTRLSQLRRFLGHCIQRGWLTTDPSWLLRAPKPPPEPRHRLTADELLALLDGADYPQHRILLALAMNLAVRGGEIQRMRVGDVNLPAGSIRVRVDKTGEVDDMPINADLDSELRRWLATYRAAVPRLGPDAFLVPGQRVDPYGGVHYRPDRTLSEPYGVVKRGLAKLGWADSHGEGVHTIRRSVARIFFDQVRATDPDGALIATMRLLHHSQPGQTLVYIGYDRQQEVRDELLRGKRFLTALARPDARVLHLAAPAL